MGPRRRVVNSEHCLEQDLYDLVTHESRIDCSVPLVTCCNVRAVSYVVDGCAALAAAVSGRSAAGLLGDPAWRPLVEELSRQARSQSAAPPGQPARPAEFPRLGARAGGGGRGAPAAGGR